MAEITTYKCDACGTMKRESNHWFYAECYSDCFILHKWESRPNQPKGLSQMHLCGMSCAVKAMHKVMSEVTQ